MIQENNTHKNNTSQQGKVEPKHFTVTSTPAADDGDNNHQHVIMIFLKHVIQTRNGQEEINPLTLALSLPHTTHLTTGPKFPLPVQTRIPESHGPRLLSIPPGAVKRTIASLSTIMFGSPRGNMGRKKEPTCSCVNIHWNSFLIASFSFKRSAVRNFN